MSLTDARRSIVGAQLRLVEESDGHRDVLRPQFLGQTLGLRIGAYGCRDARTEQSDDDEIQREQIG